MKAVQNEDHLKALPLLVIVRSAAGRVCSRNEVAQWHQMGTEAQVEWTEADFPAKVVWDYAAEIGDPTTEALAQLGVALINQQLQQQGEDGTQVPPGAVPPGAIPPGAVPPGAVLNGQAPPPPPVPDPVVPVVPEAVAPTPVVPAPVVPEAVVPTEVIVPGETPQP